MGCGLQVFVVYAYLDARNKAFIYLRNNTLSEMINFFFIILLFGGMVFTANPDAQTEAAVAYFVVVCLLATGIILVHGVFFEMCYYEHEKLAVLPCIGWLLQTRFFKFVFQSERSYLRDFKAGLQTNGTCRAILHDDHLLSFLCSFHPQRISVLSESPRSSIKSC